MDNLIVEIQGKEEFEKTLRNLVQALPIKKVESVMLDGAKVIVQAGKPKTPVGPTGKLRRAWVAKLLKRVGNWPRSAIAAIDRKKAPHAHLIEYGTSARYQKTTGRYTGIGPAHPFFRPAVDANVGRVYNQIKDTLLDFIISAARKQ